MAVSGAEGGVGRIEGMLKEKRRALEEGRAGLSQDNVSLFCVNRYITNPLIMWR